MYELTGPRLLSFHSVAAIMSDATGDTIGYVPSAAEQFVADVALDGIPRDDAQRLAELFETVLDGRNSSLTDHLGSALGRPSTDFAQYARRAAAVGN